MPSGKINDQITLHRMMCFAHPIVFWPYYLPVEARSKLNDFNGTLLF